MVWSLRSGSRLLRIAFLLHPNMHLHSPRVFNLHVPHFLRQFCFVTQCKRTCNFPFLLFRLYVTSFSDLALWEAFPKVSNLQCPFFTCAFCANPVDMFVGFLDCSLCTDLLSVPVFQSLLWAFVKCCLLENLFGQLFCLTLKLLTVQSLLRPQLFQFRKFI